MIRSRNFSTVLLVGLVVSSAGLAQSPPDPSPRPLPQPVPPEPPAPRPPQPPAPSGAPRSVVDPTIHDPSAPGDVAPGKKGAAGKAGATRLSTEEEAALRARDAASESLDFTRFLQVRSAWGPSLSPDGSRVAFVSNLPGHPQVFRLDGLGRWPHQITFNEDYVSFVKWSPTDDRLVFAMSQGGSERWQLYELTIDGERMRAIAPAPGSVNRMGAFSRDGKRMAFSSNRRDKANFDLYTYEFATGTTTRIFEGRSIWEPVAFSPDGKKVLASRSLSNLDNDLFLVGTDPSKTDIALLTPHVGEVRYDSPQWSADGKTIYLASDSGRDFMNLAKLDVATGALEFLVDEPYDVDEIAISHDGRRLAVASNIDGGGLIRVYDTATMKVVGTPKLPQGLPKGLKLSRDGKRLVFAFSGPTYTSDVWSYELATRTLSQATYSPHAGINRAVFTEPELVKFPTFDGKEISGWLYKPHGVTAPPVVMWLHGGPESQERPDFSPVQQYLVHRGLALFAPNVRGSTGYGKAFAGLDDKEKRLDALRDVEMAARMLRARKDVDGARVALIGGSYAGYLTLLAMTRYNELWAAGVNIAGFANLETYFKLTEPWRVPIRAREYGDPATQAALLHQLSPIHDAHKIKAPLLVIHGANDMRVPQSEAEQVVAAVKAHQIPVEYILFPDEGHGVVKLPNRITAWTRVGDFLVRHLSGTAGKTAAAK